METVFTIQGASPADHSILPPPALSLSHHHRKNHRGGAKEHARREREASALGISAETSSLMSTASSVSGAKKKSHRAGVKYKEKMKARSLHGLTSVVMEPLEPEERYNAKGEQEEEGH